jgi:hypothetical protein
MGTEKSSHIHVSTHITSPYERWLQEGEHYGRDHKKERRENYSLNKMMRSSMARKQSRSSISMDHVPQKSNVNELKNDASTAAFLEEPVPVLKRILSVSQPLFRKKEHEPLKEESIEARKTTNRKELRKNYEATYRPSGGDASTEMSIEDIRETIEDLRTSYHALSDLRESEAEKLLLQFKEHAKKRFEASDILIQRLQKELEQHQVTSQEREREAHLLDFYRNLTGLQVSVDEENVTLFTCSQLGRHGRVTYTLNYDEDEEGFDYVPLTIELTKTASADKENLGYFEEELFFPKNHLRLFFWRLTHSLNQ